MHCQSERDMGVTPLYGDLDYGDLGYGDLYYGSLTALLSALCPAARRVGVRAAKPAVAPSLCMSWYKSCTVHSAGVCAWVSLLAVLLLQPRPKLVIAPSNPPISTLNTLNQPGTQRLSPSRALCDLAYTMLACRSFIAPARQCLRTSSAPQRLLPALSQVRVRDDRGSAVLHSEHG